MRVVQGPSSLVPQIEALMHGRPKGEPLFPTVTGKRIRNSTFHTLVWQPAVRAAEEKGLIPFRPRIHDLRAAAATWWIENNVPAEEVADRLGHASFLTTLELYRRVNPRAAARAADVMDGLLTDAMEERRAIEG
jgi:integrase